VINLRELPGQAARPCQAGVLNAEPGGRRFDSKRLNSSTIRWDSTRNLAYGTHASQTDWDSRRKE
jgi:hypothetical protein